MPGPVSIKNRLPLLFFGIVAAIMVMPIVLGRLITDGLAMSEASLESMSSSFWINRMLHWVFSRCVPNEFSVLLYVVNGPGIRGWTLFWAFAVFGLSNQILNGTFGSHPSFDHKYSVRFHDLFLHIPCRSKPAGTVFSCCPRERCCSSLSGVPLPP